MLALSKKRVVWKDIVTGISATGARLMMAPTKKVVRNQETLQNCIYNRTRPLITICNHASTVDDPFVWSAILPWKTLWNHNSLRWSLGAQELMFTNRYDSFFFGIAGKGIPIDRNRGLSQPGILSAIDKLNQGEWIHVFPEGKVNQSGSLLPFKWGTGKLVYVSDEVPLVLPFYFTGMEGVMPLKQPYIPRPFGKTLEVFFGDPLDFKPFLEYHADKGTRKTRIWRELTKIMECEMRRVESVLRPQQKEKNAEVIQRIVSEYHLENVPRAALSIDKVSFSGRIVPITVQQ